ncbi:MAG TPA: glycosyltransferase family 2 protein [Nevskiaceae bacterium]|nr:glycosyltransferase family 2 protein [Nevskiaceae bacterium]
MDKISAYIIAYNEAEKIGDAIRSVLWADEVVVVDSNSTDGTVQIAEQLGARVVQVAFKGFGDLRNQAVAACRHPWIFSLDSDERATPEVRDEVLQTIARADALDAYLVPRRNFFMGRWIRHSGWYPNYRQPQLYRRDALVYGDDAVHETWRLTTGKPVGTLTQPVWQVPFRNLEESLRKTNRYSTLSIYRLQHKRPGLLTALAHAKWAFIRHYFLKLGILDGAAGFVIAFGYFEQTFYRYMKRHEQAAGWELPRQKEPIVRNAPVGEH